MAPPYKTPKPRPDKSTVVRLENGRAVDVKHKNIKALDPSHPNYLGNVMEELVLGDEEMHTLSKALAKLAIKEASLILIQGTPRDKASLLAKFLPYIGKSLTQDRADDDVEDLRAEFVQMQQEMMQAFGDEELEAQALLGTMDVLE